MKILLNAIIAKSKSGGGFQISRNFIRRALDDNHIEWYFLISEELANEIVSFGVKKDHIFVFPTQPNAKSYLKTALSIRILENRIRPNIVFSILAPSYFFFKTKEVMRCCNAWDVIDDDNIAWKFVSKDVTKKFHRKAVLCRYLMKRADGFITQTTTAKNGILKIMSISPAKVFVVPNVLPLAYKGLEPEKTAHNGINIMYTATPSAHKNLYCLPYVAAILRNKYKFENARFIVTLDKNSYFERRLNNLAKECAVDDMIISIGTKRQSELSEIYKVVDVGFFPSVLETFSATLLEYMKFGVPIVASDFQFNRDVADNSALYFSYDNPQEAADCIYRIITDVDLREQLQSNGAKRLHKYESFDDYYNATVSALEKINRNDEKLL